MAKRAGMYKSNKRLKELKRKKKQEEKMLRRQRNTGTTPQEQEKKDIVNIHPESSEDSVVHTGTSEDSETATE
jgi:hypothetical protein